MSLSDFLIEAFSNGEIQFVRLYRADDGIHVIWGRMASETGYDNTFERSVVEQNR